MGGPYEQRPKNPLCDERVLFPLFSDIAHRTRLVAVPGDRLEHPFVWESFPRGRERHDFPKRSLFPGLHGHPGQALRAFLVLPQGV